MVGTCAIDAAVGRPRRSTTITSARWCTRPQARHLQRRGNPHPSNDYTGNSELCTLFLRECAREGLNGRLLSSTVSCSWPNTPSCLTVPSLPRCVVSPMATATAPSTSGCKTFLLDGFSHRRLSDRHRQEALHRRADAQVPIYVNLLSNEARAVIGKTHEKTRPALKMLQDEGFVNRGYVDIFDAGPTVECEVKNIRSVRRSQKLAVLVGEPIGGRPPTSSATPGSSNTAPATATSGSIWTSTKPSFRPRWRPPSRWKMATWCASSIWIDPPAAQH